MPGRNSASRGDSYPPMVFKSRIAPLLAAAVFASLAGCAVGPDFKKPAPPPVSHYTSGELSGTVSAEVAGGQAQRFAPGSDLAGDWWTLFHSPPLNELIEQSLTNNADLKAAQAALLVARENVLAQRGRLLPKRLRKSLRQPPTAGRYPRARAEL